ncbi:MAG: ankyrin repeat domain-containing protein [Campylobacterales bacterium]|nr:ankyrin repeat domain-containing protein [Campylobacterales bacterium]
MIKQFFGKTALKESIQNFWNELLQRSISEESLNLQFRTIDIHINSKNGKGQYYLHQAIEKNFTQSAIWMIKNGADVQLMDKSGQNALDLAIEYQNTKLVEIILDLGIFDINEKDQEGRSRLQNLVMLGNNEIAKVFIQKGADLNSKDNNNRNVIYDAFSYGNQKFIETLLEFDNIELNLIDINQETIMHHKQVAQNDTIAKKLLEKGADPTIKNKYGKTYLCDTALRGIEAFDLVETALKNGANIDARVANENTILMELIASAGRLTNEEQDRRKSLFEMSKKIVTFGADKNAVDNHGETALFRAVRLNDFELTKFLLESGANVNVQNQDMQSVLHIAVYHGVQSLDIILLLLRYGASALVKNNQEKTIFEILNDIILHTHMKKELDDRFIKLQIKQDGQYMLVLKEILEHNKKDLNFLDSHDNPIFFAPLLYDHFALFKLYIKNGANIHAKNTKGHNILYEYVYKVFEDNKHNPNFQNNLTMLLSSKVEHNVTDTQGSTILQKIMTTPCDLQLFDILTDVILFDYTKTDKLGRSVMHSAIWSEKIMVMKRIHNINSKVINIPDKYGILPITYAALLGNQNLVDILLELGSNVKSNIEITPSAIEKFKPMLKNLEKLKKNVEDSEKLRQLNILIDQVKRDFHVL